MAIVPLDKVTFYGPVSRQTEIVDQLQRLGCAHLVNLSNSETSEATGPLDAEAHEAWQYLRSCPEQRRQVRRERFDRRAVVAAARQLKTRQQALQDHQDALRKAIEELEPWGEFELPESGQIADWRLWFYVIPLGDRPRLEGLRGLVWQEVRRDQRQAYVVAVSPTEPEDVPGTRVELDPRPLSRLRLELEEAEEELAALQHRRVGLTRFVGRLEEELARADDAAARKRAIELAYRRERVFALQCWAPTARREELLQFADRLGAAITVQPPGPGEQPPTLLDNPSTLRGGESCVTFYKTPGYGTWDPSPVVFFSFSLFFAMILADAGYAALMGILLWFFWRRLENQPSGRRIRGLLLSIVLFSLGYGLIANSVFGCELALLRPIQLIYAQDAREMMPLTIAIGVSHLLVGNLVTAWRQRHELRSLAAIGWSAVLVGGLLLGGAFGPLEAHPVAELMAWMGEALLVLGLLGAVLFGSTQPLFTWSVKAHLMRLVDSLQALLRCSNLFGDVLSYLRLFALGLAGARLSATFNEMGLASWQQGGLGVVLALVIILGGHSLNFVLCLMSGVVHGLRLNCIEFFNWSLQEEGYLFRPFRKKASQP